MYVTEPICSAHSARNRSFWTEISKSIQKDTTGAIKRARYDSDNEPGSNSKKMRIQEVSPPPEYGRNYNLDNEFNEPTGEYPQEEIGRGNISLTPIRPTTMPWHLSSSIAGGNASSAQSSSNGPQRKSMNSESVGAFTDILHRNSSPTSQNLPSLANTPLQTPQDHDFEFDIPASTINTMMTQPHDLHARESQLFLNYAKSLMQSTNSTCIYLFDMIRETAKATAAQAFYNVLVLAGNGSVKVVQEFPYADLKICV